MALSDADGAPASTTPGGSRGALLGAAMGAVVCATACNAIFGLDKAEGLLDRSSCDSDDDCSSSEECIDGKCREPELGKTDAGPCESGTDCDTVEACADDECEIDSGTETIEKPLVDGGGGDDDAVGECAPDDDCGCEPGDTQTCAESGLRGACADGTQVCDADGRWGECSIRPSEMDGCEPGNDDNCNGIENEDCPCEPGEERSCDRGGFFGPCADGLQTCVDGDWSDCDIEPAESDSCSPGDDSTCNDIPNEGCNCLEGDVQQSCADSGALGTCADGEQVCDANGDWSACDIEPADADTCEPGNDDNCNGIENEGCPCSIDETRSCEAGGSVGACAGGTQTCGTDGEWGACDVTPEAADSCVEDDDSNCNGVENEECECLVDQVQTCDEGGLLGPCAEGTRICSTSGTWEACSIEPQPADTCESGNDDNCNGVENEGCTCVEGVVQSCAMSGAQGTCATGQQTCGSDGTWGECDVQPASADTCEPGNDDNCNGIENQACLCVNGTTRPCSDGGLFGPCANGIQTCAQGAWGACSIQPGSADTCAPNNDANCNGIQNEGCACQTGQTRTCAQGGLSGKCANGMQTCGAGGTWGMCDITPSAQDTCISGNDDDCNGVPNEGCLCIDSQTRSCAEGGYQGTCAGGVQSCTAETWSACSISATSFDTCAANNDDNCDGVPNSPAGPSAPDYYQDLDGDGYGTDASKIDSCANPGAGWVTQGGDCCDIQGNAQAILAHPGQTASQGTALPVSCRDSDTPDYDYNCDGDETKFYTTISSGGSCCSPGAAGWVSGPAPACGVTASYKTSNGCPQTCTTESYKQRCY